jgi:hypothetical protein
MPDWKQVVHRQLRALYACSPELAESVAEELAGHLADTYEGHLQAGLPPETAFHRTLAQINRRSQICLTLRILQEVFMTGFTRKVALPGLLTFASAMVIAWVLDMAHIQPNTSFLANGLFLSIPTVWLCLLPLCGAVGALVSHRSGGSRLQRIAACLFPSAIMAAVLLVLFVAGFAVSRFVPDSGWNWAVVVPGLALWLTGQAILPAVPLLLGAGVAERARSLPTRAM